MNANKAILAVVLGILVAALLACSSAEAPPA